MAGGLGAVNMMGGDAAASVVAAVLLQRASASEVAAAQLQSGLASVVAVALPQSERAAAGGVGVAV